MSSQENRLFRSMAAMGMKMSSRTLYVIDSSFLAGIKIICSVFSFPLSEVKRALLVHTHVSTEIPLR